MHHQIEGMILQNTVTGRELQLLWNRFAEYTLGLGAYAYLRTIGENTCEIILKDRKYDKTYILGYGGAASKELLQACNIDSGCGWAFCIDVDLFAVQYLSLEKREDLYSCHPAFLERYRSMESSSGGELLYRLADILRWYGYIEVIGNPIYPDGIYKKMNMIQEKWDKNNEPYALDEPLGSLTALCTVLTPSLEDAISRFYRAGAGNVRIFEIGHIYRPQEGQLLPRERVAIALGGYGDDLSYESFTVELSKILQMAGLVGEMFFPTTQAIAYKTDECSIILSEKNQYLEANMGRINPIAEQNFGIGRQAYMANFEIGFIEQAVSELY